MGTAPRMGAAVILIGGALIGGFLFGKGQAPDRTDAEAARSAAHTSGLAEARDKAVQAARPEGREAGLARGRELGIKAGGPDGDGAGTQRAARRLEAVAAVEPAPASAVATPEDACRQLLEQPGDYGTCLENAGQDPGTPLSDYCAAHPEIVASVGFCPSLNE